MTWLFELIAFLDDNLLAYVSQLVQSYLLFVSIQLCILNINISSSNNLAQQKYLLR
ncbi:transmembrane protein, putative (macronuclear) [Tetrahymena thermophila SB210]|uniref:Transmembrane protein, putative n=1 Tax=Tetrahymena thermophila (strain SB210) TaxID=312017 RepID=W7WZF8_TETTS|nr:transmembrane protein, putative [Tetrahymena thermophila SB210]EWS70987.1 transmembrane protein, putative [Tetrahymena thermophila SB210]|eukprot:XP_012656471.1 transmembrane protein, putative [Tetrahymena thermophila SB210]